MSDELGLLGSSAQISVFSGLFQRSDLELKRLLKQRHAEAGKWQDSRTPALMVAGLVIAGSIASFGLILLQLESLWRIVFMAICGSLSAPIDFFVGFAQTILSAIIVLLSLLYVNQADPVAKKTAPHW